MPQDRPAPGSAEDWLARGRGDLAIARAPLPDGAYNGWVSRYTHDLSELITGLKEKGLDLPHAVVEADALTGFAWEARYPGVVEPVSKDEYEEAIKQAEAVVVWAEREIM